MDLSTIREFEEYFKEYPFIMVDIGASGGAVAEWKKLGKYLQIIGFEPDEREYANLSRSKESNQNIKYLKTLLYKEYNPKINFNLYKIQQLSSIYPPNVGVLSKFAKADTWRVSRNIE